MSDGLDIEYGGLISAQKRIAQSNAKDAQIVGQAAELTCLREQCEAKDAEIEKLRELVRMHNDANVQMGRSADAKDAEIERLRRSNGQWHADFFAMQDGALVQDLRAEIGWLKQWKATLHKQVDDYAERYIQEANNAKELRAENERLRKALEPFAKVPTNGQYGGPLVSAGVFYEDETADRAGKYCRLTGMDFRKAREALAARVGEGEKDGLE